ncbi:MAG: hypothetical protein L0Y55_08605, partial [Anaerolineales bacterium]|nr:hypothetical protein [Anaerolineales bacterium]
MNKKILIAIIAALVICLCCVLVGTGGAVLFGLDAFRAIAPQMTPTLPRPSSAVTLSSPSASNATVDALLRTQIPPRDLYQIVPRLRKNPALLTPVPVPAPRARNVGDRDKFFVIQNAATGEYRTANATLQVVTPHSFFWVEDGMKFDSVALKKSADFFETKVFPTNVKYFGTSGIGLDGDARIHILNTRFDDAAGYFSSVDAHPLAFAPFSNQRNIIYMNIDALNLN